jgi:hypothetical protein
MNDTLDVARHDELTRQLHGLTVQLPTPYLTQRWTDEMVQLVQCAQVDDLYIRLSRTGGWVAALLHADVIDSDLFDALNVERNAVFERVRTRLAGVGQ